MQADSIRERIRASPRVVVLSFAEHEAVSFRILTLKDFESLIARFDLSPVELVLDTLAGQAEGLPDARAVLRQLPRPTLLRLARSWATHPRTFRAIPSQIRRFSDFKTIAESKVNEWARTMRRFGERMAEQSRETFIKFSEIDRRLTDMLTQQLNAVVASFDSAGAKVEDDARELGKLGWTLPMWGPIDLVSHLAKFSAEELDEYLQAQYSRRRNELEAELLTGLRDSPSLLHWRSLLSECIDVYRKRSYLVIIPSLLTIVEGAVVSTINLYSRKPKPRTVVDEQVCNHDPGVDRAAWVSVQTFVAEVFRDHDFSAPRPWLINRHWICHGRDRPEWGRIDCLRLFQALDTIGALIGRRPQPPRRKQER